MFKRIVTACIAVLIVGCTGLPDDVEPVVGFDSERYLGTWHEIARLDHSFERNLERVTATYGLNEDGSISVLNKGFNTQKGEWRQAEGVAKPMGSRDVGHLKVSFWPFLRYLCCVRAGGRLQLCLCLGVQHGLLMASSA